MITASIQFGRKNSYWHCFWYRWTLESGQEERIKEYQELKIFQKVRARYQCFRILFASLILVRSMCGERKNKE